MPLARYFFFVGGILLALLFAIDAGSPNLPVAEQTDTAVGFPAQRIKSDRKWPERVVFDTSLPTIVPAQTQTTAAAPPIAAKPTLAEVSAKTPVLESFAQVQPAEEKKPEAKPPQKRKYAKRRVAPPMMLVEQRPRYGFFGFDTW
jgi:hypothetical protein